MKNNLIIHSIIKLTHLLGEPQAATALDLLAGQKKDFLSKLRGHLSKGLDFSLFRKPLMLAGGAVGLYLGYSSGGFLNTALLTALWGAAGAKTGEAADVLTEKCKHAKPN